MMFDPRARMSGLISSAGRALELGLLLLENRLELVSLELRQEKRELLRVLVRALLAVQLSLVALVLVCLSLVWLSPPPARGYVLLGLTALFVLLAFFAVAMLKVSAARLGKPLQRTIEEFRRDRESL